MSDNDGNRGGSSAGNGASDTNIDEDEQLFLPFFLDSMFLLESCYLKKVRLEYGYKFIINNSYLKLK